MTPERWQMVRGILESAMELRPAERGAFLDRECASDPSLRKDVDEMLSAEGKLDPGFLESPAAAQVEFPAGSLASASTLAAGTRLGNYEIRALLGAGGMGQVYRARDLLLKREVAIKIIPHFYSSDPARLHRFKQEAEATAALNHPNILTVYQVGEHEGTFYIVTELLLGETLRERLKGGPQPLRAATDCAVQIARGLAAAHENGVIHRDLKPENIFVTKDGRVKILDFGLAKLVEQRAGRRADNETIKSTATQWTEPGLVLGTTAYMSPEQVRGSRIDHRSDVFAFGAVLYEMLTGRIAFAKRTSVETMTAILNEDPPAFSQSGLNIPPGMQQVIQRCLEKQPECRFQSVSDLAFGLEALSDSGRAPAVIAPTLHRLRRRAVMWSIAVIAVILLGSAAWFAIANRNSGSPLRTSQYTQLTHNGHAGWVVGTDGSRLYLTHAQPVTFSIEQVAVSGGEIEAVSSITLPNPLLIDVSPDGSTLLVLSCRTDLVSGSLYTVQVVGGGHRYLADAAIGSGTWSPDGKHVAYSTLNGDINVINSDGTGAHKIASVGGAAYPVNWSPDGSKIRFSKDDANSLWEITSSGSNLHQLLAGWHPSEGKCCGQWSPDGGFFIFLAGPQGSDIYALDERPGIFHLPAKDPILLTSGPTVWSPPIFSKDGKKIFATGSTKRGELVRLDPKSNQFQPFLGGISADVVAFSKDGHSVAYVTFPDGILWKANRDGGDRVQLSSPPLSPQSLAWSPDNTQLIFEAPSPEGPHAWIVPSTGGSPQRLLPDDGGQETDPSWSPDGLKVIFATGAHPSRESHIRILDLASHQISTLPGSDGKFSPRWSPDGQFIYASSLDTSVIYVFNIKTQRWTALNTAMHAYARWSKDSRSIYFLRWGSDPAILRIAAAGGEAKVVASLKGFPFTGTVGLWLGLDPSDAPLMLRDESTTDVYALTLEEK